MRRLSLTFLFLAGTIMVSFSQEPPARLPENYIISNVGVLSMGYFQLANGTLLSDKDAFERLSQYPGNNSILANEKAWKISFLSTMGISTGTLATMLFFKIKNEYTSDIDFWCSPILISSLLWDMVSALQENYYRNKATSNYNLFILGISVPHK